MKHDFMQMKQEIEEATAKVERAKGAMESIKAELKDEFGFDTIDEAEDYVEQTDKDIVALKEQVEELSDDIQSQLEKIRESSK